MSYELQCQIKVSPNEITYREENFHDISTINNDDIQCTACGEQLIVNTECCYVNRTVGTLQCQVCYDRCEENQPWEPTNRLEFCLMCAKSSEPMQKCRTKNCTYLFCQACILRNKSETFVETNKREWNCFICNCKQIYQRRAIAAAVMASLAEKSCDRPIKRMTANGHTLNKIKKKKTRNSGKSNINCSSDSSDECVFHKKLLTQKPSTSTALTQSNDIEIKSKNCIINSSSINHDNNSTQLSIINNSSRKNNKRETINNNTQELTKKRKLNGEKKKFNTQINEKNHNNNNTNNNINKTLQVITRDDSNSNSEKEFSCHKIIPSYVSLHRISDIDKDYTTSPNQSQTIDVSSINLISKQDAFVLKNNIHHFLQNMKDYVKKVQNDIEIIEKNYHYRDNLKTNDSTNMMVKCINLIRNLKEHVNNSEDKVINNYDKWCKKTKIKNIFINKTHIDNDTPKRYKNNIKEPMTIYSSDSDSDVTLIDYSTLKSNDRSHTNKRIRSNSTETVINDDDNGQCPPAVEISDFDEREIFSMSETSNSPSPIASNSNINDKEIIINNESNVNTKELPKDNIKSTVNNNNEQIKSIEAGENLSSTDKHNMKINKQITNNSSSSIVSQTIDEFTNSSKKTSRRSSSMTHSKLDSNINCNSSQSSVDMFEDENDGDDDDDDYNNVKSSNQSRLNSSINEISSLKKNSINSNYINLEKDNIKDSTATSCENNLSPNKIRQSPVISDHDNDVEMGKKEKVKEKNSTKIISQSAKEQIKSPSVVIEEKLSNNNKSELSNGKSSNISTESIDSINKSILNTTDSIDDDNVVDINEEEAKKALLDSSSDSEHETLINTSTEKNNSYLDDNEILLSETENSINNEENIPTNKDLIPLKHSNNCLVSQKLKRDKFILNNNKYYKCDAKLRMTSIVKLSKLDNNILELHSNALKLSKEYLENKQIKSLVSIDNLEVKNKKSHVLNSSTSSSPPPSDSENSIMRQTKSKQKDEDESEETLLDHLNKALDNNDNNSDDNDDRNSESQIETLINNNLNDDDTNATENLISAADNFYKNELLGDSSHSELEDNENNKNDEDEDNLNKNNDEQLKKNKNDNNKRNTGSDSSIDEDLNNDNNKWKRSKVLTINFSDTDSEEENRKIKRMISLKKENSQNSDNNSSDKEDDNDTTERVADSSQIKKKRAQRRRLASDSDIKITDDSNDSDLNIIEEKKTDKKKKLNDKKDDDKKLRKRQLKSDCSSDSSTSFEHKKIKPKRKRIRAVADDSDSDSANEQNSSQGGNKSGRKNIRKVLKDKQVAEDTKQAGKLEEERLKRMAERQKLYNEMYEARLAIEEKVDKLVLDFDEESKEVLLSVDKNLVKRLKPHQARGIKFMWDAAYESLERAKTTSGSGCILAHCMGLGKSFQVVTLSHTLLSNSEKTGVNTILIVAPLSTVLNWVNEFKIWLYEVDNGDDIEIYEMTKCKTTYERKYQLESWHRTGGILIIGYEMFRNLTNATKKMKKSLRESILKCLVDPGADLVICDEGHLLKNEDSAISKAMRRVKTLRRVVLTGTPLQNNLTEYHCMVQFVKPNLLGTKKEFSNRFVNPIQNGQFDDSTEYDVKVMKKRAHVLHKMLEGSVQRFDYSVLMPFLPPKQEYVILTRLTPVQVKLYQYYIDNIAGTQSRAGGGTLFADFQALQRIWTHPSVVKSHAEKMIDKRRDADTDSEGSLKDFIDDDSASDSSTKSSDNNNSDVVNINSSGDEKIVKKRGTRANPINEPIVQAETENKGEWWREFVKSDDINDVRVSAKLLLLYDIVKECEAIGDKILVFSQSLYSLTLIEKFLSMIDDETQKGNKLESLDNHTGSWSFGLDYFRIDGQTSADNRSHWVKLFNKPSNTRARLFLISTRAGGLGINLTGANRVIIFDASWNPSHDVQSIFRVYRFGQKKPCFIYRLLAAGTMEEKIYNRQVTKLSLACRVVDEQQIERHFSNNDLAELYRFDPPKSEPSQLALPKDRLIAEIFLRHKNLIETYHEHDSLLENIAEEELDDEERKQAWLEYEQEKAGKLPMPMQMNLNYQQQPMFMAPQFNNMNELNVQTEFDNLLQLLRKDYPHLTEHAQKDMAFRALSQMYSYVENQITTNLNNPINMPRFNNPNNPTATLANALAQQEYTRQHSTVSKHQQQQQLQQQQQMQYAQKFGNNIGNVTTPMAKTTTPTAAASQKDDIVVIPSSSGRTNSNLPTSSTSKRQEE